MTVAFQGKRMTSADSDSDGLYVALDQGTTSSRVLVFAADGSVHSSAQVALPVSFPQDGWVEQDPAAIWQTQLEALRQATAQLPLEKIRSFGITNQRETTLVWDRQSGKPLAPAIVWQCRRSQDLCAAMDSEKNRAIVRERAGVVIDPYFSASKIRWLYENYPDVRAAMDDGSAACGTVDSWLLYQMSGGSAFCTEPSNASRTMLLSIKERTWDDQLLSLWDIPKRCLPDVLPSAGTLITSNVLGPEIPVTGVLGDQQAALLGHGCITRNSIKCTFGTGAFLLLNTGTELARSSTGLLTTVAWDLPEQPCEYALEGSIFVAGAAVQWLRDQLGLVAESAETEALARQVASTGGVIFVPSFTGLGAPHWKPSVRGAILGITRDTSTAHIVRACLEGVAHQLADLIEDPYFAESASIGIDGGMSQNAYFAEVLANISQREIVRHSFSERTALGAARIACLGVGDVDSLEQACKELHVPESCSMTYSPGADSGSSTRARWKEAIARLID